MHETSDEGNEVMWLENTSILDTTMEVCLEASFPVEFSLKSSLSSPLLSNSCLPLLSPYSFLKRALPLIRSTTNIYKLCNLLFLHFNLTNLRNWALPGSMNPKKVWRSQINIIQGSSLLPKLRNCSQWQVSLNFLQKWNKNTPSKKMWGIFGLTSNGYPSSFLALNSNLSTPLKLTTSCIEAYPLQPQIEAKIPILFYNIHNQQLKQSRHLLWQSDVHCSMMLELSWRSTSFSLRSELESDFDSASTTRTLDDLSSTKSISVQFTIFTCNFTCQTMTIITYSTRFIILFKGFLKLYQPEKY